MSTPLNKKTNNYYNNVIVNHNNNINPWHIPYVPIKDNHINEYTRELVEQGIPYAVARQQAINQIDTLFNMAIINNHPNGNWFFTEVMKLRSYSKEVAEITRQLNDVNNNFNNNNMPEPDTDFNVFLNDFIPPPLLNEQ